MTAPKKNVKTEGPTGEGVIGTTSSAQPGTNGIVVGGTPNDGGDEPGAEVVEVAEIVPETRQVKIRAIMDHKCIIAGVDYTITKDREYSVNEDVAMALHQAGKAFITGR